MVNIDSQRTGLVIIDLQKGIAGMGRNLEPYSAEEVIGKASELADACRKNNIPVFLVHINPAKETRLNPPADNPMLSTSTELPHDWAELVSELGRQAGDVIITKHHWGAFYGTDLDMQLRRRGIDTIILCGIATSIGVESTARFAYEYGYKQIFAEDAMTAMSTEEHEMSVEKILKRIGQVRKTQEILGKIK